MAAVIKAPSPLVGPPFSTWRFFPQPRHDHGRAGASAYAKGTLTFPSGTIDGTITLINSNLDVGASATGEGNFVFYDDGSNCLSGTIPYGLIFTLATNSEYTSTNVFYAAGTNNGGTIDMQPDTQFIWGDETSNTLTNLPAGTIEAVAGNGDAAGIVGDFDNEGAIIVGQGATLNLNRSRGYATPTFIAEGGTMTVSGTLTCSDINLNISSSASGTGHLSIYGTCNLSGSVGPDETLLLATDSDNPTQIYTMRPARAMPAPSKCRLTLGSIGRMHLPIH